jgi:small subunit ribosomal protein S21
MLIIKLNKQEDINKALKRYKQKVDKTKLVKELRDRTEYVKKSVKNRRTKQKAQYIQQLKSKLD